MWTPLQSQSGGAIVKMYIIRVYNEDHQTNVIYNICTKRPTICPMTCETARH